MRPFFLLQSTPHSSSSFLFSFTSYYRLIHNPHHLKTFLSVQLRDRAGRISFFFFFKNISLLVLISPQHDVTLSRLKIPHFQPVSARLFHKDEVGLIILCNWKSSWCFFKPSATESSDGVVHVCCGGFNSRMSEDLFLEVVKKKSLYVDQE